MGSHSNAAGKRLVNFPGEGWALATTGDTVHWMRTEGNSVVSLCRCARQSKWFALFEPGKARRCKHCVRLRR